ERREPALFGLWQKRRKLVRVLDHTGVVRLQRSDAEIIRSRVGTVARDLEEAIARLTDFGDAGRALPDTHVLARARLIDLSGLADVE
ncbi:hypothetical protein OFN60_36630, partial [Escherichia coli]|nr:hypothetical protein [Escherichia coli]